MVSTNVNFNEAKQPVIGIFHRLVKGSLSRQSVGSISNQSDGYCKQPVSKQCSCDIICYEVHLRLL